MERSEPTVEDVLQFVRLFTGTKRSGPSTKIDYDLGVTGGDGPDLLSAAEKHFGVDFPAEDISFKTVFNLGPNEYLFGDEGLDLLNIMGLIRWLRREPAPIVKDLTVLELRDAILKSIRLASASAV